MKADPAYNSEHYKGKRPAANTQEDYCTPVYDEWMLGKLDTNQHQKPTRPIIGNGGAQSSAKPSQF